MRLLYNSVFLKHACGKQHAESPGRLSFFGHLPDSRVINGEKFLRLCHTQEHIDSVRQYSSNSLSLGPDTYTCRDSFESACYAAGAAVQASEGGVFALVRPPGHHASMDRSEGFCLFNNTAIASRHLLKKGKRVFVLDFDLHHGNGTQELLKREKNAMYFSTHLEGVYPGTGERSAGNALNFPLRAGARDVEYISLLEKRLVPALEEFMPDTVAVSAGFDSYYKDMGLLGEGTGFSLTRRSYEKIKQILSTYNHFMVLEGGYNPESVFEGVSVFCSV